MSFGQAWQLVKESASAWVNDYASSMGAAIAYYTVFSIAPLLLIVIAVAGFFFGSEVAERAIVAARFPSARLIDNLALPEPG